MVSGQVQVSPQEVTATASKTGDKAGEAETIQQKIASAQVPGNSWGLVGLITVGAYSELLGALNDHMNTMSQGIQNLAGTIKSIADNYQQNEDEVSEKFADIDKDLGVTAVPPAPAGGEG